MIQPKFYITNALVYNAFETFLGILGLLIFHEHNVIIFISVKIAFPVQNMGVIFDAKSKVDSVVCVQERYAKFASEFSLGAFKIVA